MRIGKPQREIEVEPLPEQQPATEPQPETEPA